MALKVGIIGGAGRMGSSFADVFDSTKYDILISDIDEAKLKQMEGKGYQIMDSERVASLADLLIFSVPIVDTPAVIRQYAPLVRGEGKGLTDLTSTKVEPMAAMLEAANPEVEIIGMHPMYGPGVSMEGQNVVLFPVRPEKGGFWAGQLEKIIEKNRGSYFHSTPEEHDHYMSVVQGLAHATQFIFAETLRRLNVDLGELAHFSSKFYDTLFNVLWRVYGMNNPELYGQIQLGNPENPRVLEVMEEVVRAHRGLISQGTLQQFSEMYKMGREYLGQYAEIAERKIAPLIGSPPGVPVYYDRDDKPLIESALEEELPTSPYKEWLYTANVSQGTLGKIIRGFPFARYTIYIRSEEVGDARITRQEGTYAFYVSNRKHPEHQDKGVVFSPVVPVDTEKAPARHQHHLRVQMRNTYMDPWLNLFQAWREHPELHSMGILVAGQTRHL